MEWALKCFLEVVTRGSLWTGYDWIPTDRLGTTSAVFVSTLFCQHWCGMALHPVVQSPLFLPHSFLNVISPGSEGGKDLTFWLKWNSCFLSSLVNVFFIFLGISCFSRSLEVDRRVLILLASDFKKKQNKKKPLVGVLWWSNIAKYGSAWVALAFQERFFTSFTANSTLSLALLLYGLMGMCVKPYFLTKTNSWL